MPVRVNIPHDWEPRDYQMPAWLALEGGCKRALLFWHRRAGKDLFGVNFLMKKAMERSGAYWHIFPTYRQGRKIAWEGSTKTGRPFRDHFPEEIITRKRDAEMILNFMGGSSYHVVGADNPDSQVGTNPVGMIFSEWAVMGDPKIWQYLQPILIENDGWAMFITTPRGRNHAHRMKERWQKNPKCYVEVLTVEDSIHQGKRVVSEEAIDEARAEGMTEDMVQQEFYCSFDASLENAYFGKEMRKAADEGRITHVPFDPKLRVETWWDLGIEDYTVIWYVQRSQGMFRIIDCDYASGQSLAHYAQLIHDKREKWEGVIFRTHILPHDGGARNIQTGMTAKAVLQGLGIRPVKRLKRDDRAEGIRQVRMMLGQCWFDDQNCVTGIDGLRQYAREPLEGQEDPDGNQLYGSEPVHNWASHFADAFRTGAMGSRRPDSVGDDGKPRAAPMAIV